MDISRRSLAYRSAGAIFGAVALSGCGIITDTNGVITVNLTNAQAEANTLYSAFNTEFAILKPLLTTVVVSEVSTFLPDLKAAVDIFTALPATTTLSGYKQIANQVLILIEDILPLISPVMGTATVVAITDGVAIIEALINGIGTVPIPPTSVTSGVKATGVISGPIPIPLS